MKYSDFFDIIFTDKKFERRNKNGKDEYKMELY